MRVTIVVEDNKVIVDGKPQTVDCSQLAGQGKHAVQWFDTYGEEEFATTFDAAAKIWVRTPNNPITDFAPYQHLVDEWEEENQKQLEAEQHALREQQKMLDQQQIIAERGEQRLAAIEQRLTAIERKLSS